jgi:hypothetical protein
MGNGGAEQEERHERRQKVRVCVQADEGAAQMAL